MSRMIRSALITTTLSFALLACGGGGAAGPTALSWHYDEVYIAQLSIEEQSSVLKAQSEYHRARAKQMKAEADLSESNTTLKISKNELKQALLSEKSAQQGKKAAEGSGDMTRVNLASKELRIAELGRRASDEKVSYIKAHQKYLKKYVRYCQEETYHREARYEQAKATLGKAKNIAPKGIQYDKFKGQTDARSRKSQIARQVAKDAEKKAETKKLTWKGRLKEANSARGISTSSNDSESSTPSADAN